MSDTQRPTWIARMGERLVPACIGLAIRHRWLVVAAALLAASIAAYASTSLSISTETRDILSPDLGFFRLEERYREAFPAQEPAIVIIDGESPGQARAAAAGLADRLRRHRKLFERVEVPGESEFFRRHALLYPDAGRLRSMTEQLAQAGAVLSVLARDPTLRGVAEFVGVVRAGGAAAQTSPGLAATIDELAKTTAARADGKPATMTWSALLGIGDDGANRRALVLAQPTVREPSILATQPSLAQLHAEVAEARQAYPRATLRVTGFPELRQQELHEVFSGAAYASVLSFILVSLSLALIGSWRVVAALVLSLIIGSVITTGLASISVGRLNLISVAFLVLFFGLGVDFGTHLGLRLLEEMRAGARFRQAMTRAGLGEAPGISLSALCAAIGFLSFVPTSYVGLAEFGIISSFGILVGVAITYTLLPALMSAMPPKPRGQAGVRVGLGAYVRRHHRAILAAAALATVVAAVAAPRIRMDVNPLNLQNPDSVAVRAYRDLAKDPSTSPYALDTIVQNREAARDLARRLRGLPEVSETRTIESFVPDDQNAKLELIGETARRLGPALRAARRAEPDDGERQRAFEALRQNADALASADDAGAGLAAAARRLTEALEAFAKSRGTGPADLRQLETALTSNLPGLVRNLQAMLSVSRPIALNDLPQDLRREWLTPDGRARVQILPAGAGDSTEALASFARRVQAVAPDVTGVPVDVTAAGAAVRRAFFQATAYTVAAIAILILVLRRSFADLLLVLAPLGLASLWTIAGSVLLGLPFNFANVIVIPLLLGLGVASSVHMVVRAREAPGAIGDVLDTSTPLAVFVAQLNTAAAFATLAVAEHRGLFSMGVLLGLAILFVLIASLVVLPAGMVLLDEMKAQRQRRKSGWDAAH